MNPEDAPINPEKAAFTATRWTIISGAKTQNTDRAQEALAVMCQTYWFPLYAFVRRKGYSQHDAEDLTQSFFERLLSRDFLANVAREKGKFRSFLLTSMKHHLNDEYARKQRLKRGGSQKVISLDQSSAEERYHLEPVDRLTPEHLFEKQWILTLLEQVLTQLRNEYVAQGKAEVFDKLKILLTAGKGAAPFSQLAEELDLTESATRMAASRLRRRYRDMIREEIAHTVSSSEEVEGELSYLFEALGR